MVFPDLTPKQKLFVWVPRETSSSLPPSSLSFLLLKRLLSERERDDACNILILVLSTMEHSGSIGFLSHKWWSKSCSSAYPITPSQGKETDVHAPEIFHWVMVGIHTLAKRQTSMGFKVWEHLEGDRGSGRPATDVGPQWRAALDPCWPDQ